MSQDIFVFFVEKTVDVIDMLLCYFVFLRACEKACVGERMWNAYLVIGKGRPKLDYSELVDFFILR